MTSSISRTQSIDTEADAERVQIEIIRRMPVWKKFEQIVELNHTLRRLALADIRRTHQHADEREVRRRLAARLLPPDLFEAAYGKD